MNMKMTDSTDSTTVPDFSAVMSQIAAQHSQHRAKSVALYLWSLSGADRCWLLKQLPAADRTHLQHWLKQIKDLGLSVDRSTAEQLLQQPLKDRRANVLDALKQGALQEDIPYLAMSLLALDNPDLQSIRWDSADKQALLQWYQYAQQSMPPRLIATLGQHCLNTDQYSPVKTAEVTDVTL